MSKIRDSWAAFDNLLRNGELSKGQAKRGLKEYASEFSNVSRELRTGSDEWVRWGEEADKVSKKLKSSDLASTGGFIGSLKRNDVGGVLENIGARFDDLGIRITGVSSFLRGFFDLAKIGFSQQLITGVASLAGSFISLASAAAQAGAALAGAFVSGLGQAIPMISIVAASVERFKSILQAVSITSQAEQQHYYDPTEKQRTQLQNTSQLISSQQQLSNSYVQLYEAQQRVRDSQISLTEARYNALRSITELSLAEKNARLQAEGVNISLAEARRQLQIEIQRGDTAGLASAELAVREAELGKQKAEFEVPKAEREARLARQRGISGAPTVISATEGLAASRQGVVQARQAAEAARRQEQITQLTQQARSSRETSQESQLSFLKKGFSPTELGLYNALVGIEKELKSPNSPLKKITDYFVEPFTNAVKRIRSLLKDSSFLKPIDELAKSMGAGLGRLENAALGKSGTSFFETMAKDAFTNIPVVVSSIEHLMNLFEDIAKAADPAFHKLSEDWNNFWSALDKRESSPEGLNKLEQFFNRSIKFAESFAHLGKAVTDLFLAIGHDAAPQGLQTVTTFSQTIEKATQWVQSHGPEVTKFFEQARKGLSVIGELLFGIGTSLIQVFDLESLRAFSQFINRILLPAMKDVVEVLGFITEWLLKIADAIPGGKSVLEGLAALLLGIEVLGKIAKPVIKLIDLYKELRYFVIAANIVMGESGVVSAISNIGTTVKSVIAQYKLLKATSIETAATIEATSAAEASAIGEVAAAETVTAGGAVLPAGVTAAEAGAAAGGGILAGLSRFAGPVAGAALVGDSIYKGLGSSGRSQGFLSDTTGFLTGGLLGNASTSPVGIVKKLFGGDESQERIEKFNSKVQDLKSKLGSLPKSKLEEVQHEAESLASNPSLTKYKNNLEEVAKGFNPFEIAAKKSLETTREYMEKLSPAAREVAKSFESINTSTGTIWKNIKNVLKENIESIRENLGLNSRQGKEALAANFEGAKEKIEESMNKGTMSTKIGMERIKKLVSEALSKYGVKPTEIEKQGVNLSGLSGSAHAPGHATGAYIPATSGGHRARIGEGGYDEVVLTTDPRYAKRQKQLLGQYFSRAPHMAQGGFVADPGTNFSVGQEPKIVTELRKLGEYLNTTIYGISGYRSPQHSVEVGGFADDPHTRGEAADIGVGSNTLASAARLTAGLLAKFDLYRPFYPASAHEINHVQLIPGTLSGITGSVAAGSIGGAGTGEVNIPQLTAPKIKGGGAVGAVVQASLNLATKAANIYLGKQGGGGTAEKALAAIGNLKGKIVTASEFGGHNDPSAYGRSTASGKIANDTLMGFAELSNPPGSLNFSALGGLPMGTRIKVGYNGRYITVPKVDVGAGGPGLDGRVRAIDLTYAASRALDAPGLENVTWQRMASGGILGGNAPWGGRPVPVILHEGERVLNPYQYHETARMAGTSAGGLDSHLGFTNSPRHSFATGGKVAGLGLPGIASLISNASEIGSIESLMKIIKSIAEGFQRIGKTKTPDKYKTEIVQFFENIEKAFEVMNEGREYLKSRLTRRAVSREYTETGITPAHSYRSNGGLVRIGRVNTGAVASAGGESKVAEESFKILREENVYIGQQILSLNNERKSLNESIKKSKSSSAVKMFRNELRAVAKRQKEIGELASTNIEARYQAEIQVIQSKLAEANSIYQTINQTLSGEVSKAQSLGNLGQVGPIEEQIKSAAENQIKILEPLLKSAEATGNVELTNSIKQEMIGLRQSITSAVVEEISNAQAQIQREAGLAESKTGMLESLSKTAVARGEYGRAGQLEREALENKQISLLSTRASEEQLKSKAASEGDTAAVIALTEELNKNTAEIEENNLALKENATVTRELIISQIEQTGQFKKGIYGAAIQGLEIVGKTTGYTNVAALISAAKGESTALGTERTELEKQAGELGSEHNKSLGVEGMTPEQILAYLASPAGQAKLAELEKGDTEAEKKQLYGLVQALEGNAIATIQNTQKLAELNGSLNQPQTWSTVAQNAFRIPIFTGMGQLNPAYQNALPPGSAPTGLPTYGTNAPAQQPVIGNLNLTHPVEKIDTQLFGEEISHHIATAPVIQ